MSLPDNVTHAALDRAYPGPITGYSISPEALVYGAVDGILFALLGDTDTMDGALDQAARDCVVAMDDDGEVLDHVRKVIDYRRDLVGALHFLVTQAKFHEGKLAIYAEQRRQAARREAAAAKAMREAGQ